MKTLTARAQESMSDLRTSSVSEKAIDAIELTDTELKEVAGGEFGFGGFGGGFGGFGGGFGGFGGFCIPVIPIIPFCGCGFGGWGW